MAKDKDNRQKNTPQDIFLIGNPNSGKTSLFNAITGERHHVGNWPGVTVERLEGITHTDNGDIHITDLPGTYSLSPATPEEAVVLTAIDEAAQGSVLNVVDSTNLVRNLFLTTQLIEIGINPVISLNCYDSFTQQGGHIDLQKFTKLTGCEIYPTVGRTGKGVPSLVEYLSKRNKSEITSNSSSALALPEKWLNAAKEAIKLDNLRWETATAMQRYNTITKLFKITESNEKLNEIRQNLCNELSANREKPVTPATLACNLAEDRYHRIERMVKVCATVPEKSIPEWQQKIDRVLVHQFWSLPIFVALMYFVFWTTFTIGQYPMDWLEAFVDWLAKYVGGLMSDGILKDLVVEGAIKSVGSVIVFIPNILILFFWIVLLEDSGYMSRAAFIVDRTMKSMGLQGRAFIPMVMGIGCNVPAIMATRIIDSKFQRLLTMFLIPLVSCSARLPVFVLLCGTFFPNNPTKWMCILYFIDLVVLMLLGHIVSLLLNKVEDSPFLLEMPPYRIPTVKSVWNMLKEKAWHFLEKAGTVVLAGSILVWALQSFPRNVELSFDYEGQKAALEAPFIAQKTEIEKSQLSEKEKKEKLDEIEAKMAEATSEIDIKKKEEETEKRYLGRIGKFMHPAFAPLGFTWKETVTLIPGFFAKETLVSTLAVLYQTEEESDDNSDEDKKKNREKLAEAMKNNGITPLIAFVYMLFTLLYVPCIATVGILWRESGSTKFTIFSLLAYFGLAYIISFVTLKAGEIILARGSNGAQEALVVLFALIAAWIMLTRLINGLKGKPSGVGCGCGCDGCNKCTNKK